MSLFVEDAKNRERFVNTRTKGTQDDPIQRMADYRSKLDVEPAEATSRDFEHSSCDLKMHFWNSYICHSHALHSDNQWLLVGEDLVDWAPVLILKFKGM